MQVASRAPAKIGVLLMLVVGMFAMAPGASANVVRINFGSLMGQGSGYADLTIGDTDPGDVVDGSNPKTITGASGMFNGVAITGLFPIDPIPPPPGETKIPHAYSLFSIPGYGDHDGVSYDNLFYPDGSPQICYIEGVGWVYPFSGGFLDLMGIMFQMGDGSYLDLWSFGVTPPGFFDGWQGGLLYGLKRILPDGQGGWVVPDMPPFAVAQVPEPGFLWLFGAGLLGLLVWRRSRTERAVNRIV